MRLIKSLLPTCLLVGLSGITFGQDYDEADILMKLFEGTKGYRWKNKEGWAQAESVCDWYGVTCYGDDEQSERRNRVSKLDLSENKLVGALPQEIYQLKYMYSMTLRDNPDLTVSVERIGEAVSLKHLILSNTKISSLDGLTDARDTLRRLHLTDCELGGEIPKEIYQMTKLVALLANYNDFTGQISPDIGNLQNLVELFLYENRLTGNIPSQIGRLTDLQIIALANNAFSGNLPPEMNNLVNLEVIAIQREDGDIHGPGISGPLLDFDRMESLREVYLQNQRIEGSISYDFLKNAPRDDAMIVDLRNNRLSGHVPGSLDAHSNMKLYLSGNQFDSMSKSLCDNTNWMSGDVTTYGCDGILCPVGKYSEKDGRGDCQACASADVMGMKSCPDEGYNQKEILAFLYDAMNGENWKDNSGWKSAEDECTVYGVTCDDNGDIVKIELGNNKLAGTPPPVIFTLPKLNTLDFSRNFMDFRFDGIYKAKSLEHLILYSTGLTSLNDVEQLNETPIQELVLSSNVLSGVIPPSLFQNKNLRYLSISYNNFSGPIPTTIGELSLLEYFHAYSNRLSGEIPSEFGMLSNTLKELILSENSLTGEIPQELNSMANLREISIHQTSFKDDGLSGSVPSFKACPLLQVIHLASNKLTGDLPGDLLANSNVLDRTIEVNLSENKITGIVPQQWVRFESLNVDLGDNQITGISNDLCEKGGWQDQNTARFKCDAILCPPNYHNEYGRQSPSDPCVECGESSGTYMGSTKCGEVDQLTDRIILGKFYYATGGPKWNKNDGWTTAMNVCTDWYGITCNENGEIIKIALEDNGLYGKTNTELFKLKTLEEIDLRSNSVSFVFSGIGEAENLKTLYLSETDTTELEGIGDARYLEKLHLTGNDISGSIPHEIFVLTNLRSLFLNYNRFSGRLSSHVSNLHNLEELYLLSNQLDGQIPASIGELQKLKILALTENKFGGTLPEELNELRNIEILAIQHEGGVDGNNVGGDTVGTNQAGTNEGVGITGPLLSFNKLENLKELYLGGNSLSSTIPYDFLDGIKDKEKNIVVDLISNKLEGRVPSALAQFDALDLYLAGNRFTDVAAGLCSKSHWMKDEVGKYDCYALLCPPNTRAKFGRQSSDADDCEACGEGSTATYYGSFECLNPEGQNTEAEKLILESLYQKLNGNGWAFNSNWLDSDKSICDWQGVTCKSGSAPTVLSINLPNNNLKGKVPIEIFNLPNLEELNLANNMIEFEDLSAIEKATNLKYLNVDSTGITSLAGIDKSQSLTLLHAKYNNFKGEFPTEILSLNSLEMLYLSDNEIGDQLPSKLSSMNNLVFLECGNCGLKGAIPGWIGDMAKIEHIGLKGNLLTGNIPTNLLSKSTLEHIDFSEQTSRGGSGLNGDLPDFSNLPKLSELYLNKNSLSGSISADFLKNVDKSKPIKIDLRDNKIVGAVPSSALSGFSDITILLANNQISEIPDSVCDEYNSTDTSSMNQGDVKTFGCNAILCPIGYFNSLGRASRGMECKQCNEESYATFLGETDCGEDIQKDILNRVFADLNGPDWTLKDGWGAVDDICDWSGITCDGEKHVVEIVLDENNLQGVVPDEIFNLPKMKVLSLKQNQIDMSFSGIGKALELEQIKLSDNGITSVDGIGNSKSLKSIHLTGNKLQSIPDEIYSMVQLESLFLNYNEISSQISTQIGQLTSLRELFLFHNKISGPIPKEIGNLEKLEILALGENEMTGVVPDEINKLINLQILAIQRETGDENSGVGGPLKEKSSDQIGKGFTGKLPAFNTMPYLNQLYLGSNSFTGMIPSSFLEGITDKTVDIKVDLTLNNLLGSVPSNLKSFSKMKLYLAGNQIDEIPSDLCGLGDWMGGAVESGKCDAILCAPGTANPYGRQVNSDTPCETCPYSFTAEFFGSLSCSADQNNYSEREILRMFYEQTGGSEWEVKNNWMEDSVSICKWHGVHCASEDADGGDDVVTQIHLPSNKLTGTVPPLVFSLPHLQMLNLRDNYVNVEFHGISEAKSLTELYIDSTKTTSLAGIGNAKNLVTLHVQENNFAKNPIPSELFDLSKLRHLYISDSNIGGTLPSVIGKLTDLEEFYCHGNDITGEIPSQIGNLEKLEILVMSENRFIGTLPREIGNLSSLESLFIDSFTRPGVGLSGPLPSFSNFPRLREIYLGDNSFTGTIPAEFLSGLNDFQQTVTVGLKSNQISGALPNELKRFHKLNIDISDNLITSIDEELCNKEDWMEGGVGKYRCNAILCPQGTFNQYGRQSNDKNICASCKGDDTSTYLGKIMCETEEKKLEREILTLFYKTCGGDNWKRNDNWLDPEVDVCHWYGISCHQGKTVDSILLGANNIIGTPPQQIFRMAHLKWLWLYSNPLNFSFKGIEYATHLTSLLIDSTGLVSLEGIGGATQLTDLDIRFNSLSGPLTEEINNLIYLETLSMSNNNFDGTIPSFDRLTNLKSLRMGDNLFTGGVPSFETHSKMTSLDLSGNRLSGQIPSNLLKSSSTDELIFIDLSSNTLTGVVPNELKRFDKMTLYLRDNFLEGIDPALCAKNSWNDGDVGNFDCDGLLCSKGTYSVTGRASKDGNQCIPCADARYFGQSQCVVRDSADSSLDKRSIRLALMITGILMMLVAI